MEANATLSEMKAEIREAEDTVLDILSRLQEKYGAREVRIDVTSTVTMGGSETPLAVSISVAP